MALEPAEIIRVFERRRRICLAVGVPVVLAFFAAATLAALDVVDLNKSLTPIHGAVFLIVFTVNILLWLFLYRCPACNRRDSLHEDGVVLNPDRCGHCGAALK